VLLATTNHDDAEEMFAVKLGITGLNCRYGGIERRLNEDIPMPSAGIDNGLGRFE
jgi:hypothetical protein